MVNLMIYITQCFWIGWNHQMLWQVHLPTKTPYFFPREGEFTTTGKVREFSERSTKSASFYWWHAQIHGFDQKKRSSDTPIESHGIRWCSQFATSAVQHHAGNMSDDKAGPDMSGWESIHVISCNIDIQNWVRPKLWICKRSMFIHHNGDF